MILRIMVMICLIAVSFDFVSYYTSISRSIRWFSWPRWAVATDFGWHTLQCIGRNSFVIRCVANRPSCSSSVDWRCRRNRTRNVASVPESGQFRSRLLCWHESDESNTVARNDALPPSTISSQRNIWPNTSACPPAHSKRREKKTQDDNYKQLQSFTHFGEIKDFECRIACRTCIRRMCLLSRSRITWLSASSTLRCASILKSPLIWSSTGQLWNEFETNRHEVKHVVDFAATDSNGFLVEMVEMFTARVARAARHSVFFIFFFIILQTVSSRSIASGRPLRNHQSSLCLPSLANSDVNMWIVANSNCKPQLLQSVPRSSWFQGVRCRDRGCDEKTTCWLLVCFDSTFEWRASQVSWIRIMVQLRSRLSSAFGRIEQLGENDDGDDGGEQETVIQLVVNLNSQQSLPTFPSLWRVFRLNRALAWQRWKCTLSEVVRRSCWPHGTCVADIHSANKLSDGSCSVCVCVSRSKGDSLSQLPIWVNPSSFLFLTGPPLAPCLPGRIRVTVLVICPRWWWKGDPGTHSNHNLFKESLLLSLLLVRVCSVAEQRFSYNRLLRSRTLGAHILLHSLYTHEHTRVKLSRREFVWILCRTRLESSTSSSSLPFFAIASIFKFRINPIFASFLYSRLSALWTLFRWSIAQTIISF